MTTERPALEPLRPAFQLQTLTDEQLEQFQEATLTVLEEVGVHFPSEKALKIFAEHGATVEHKEQIVKLSRDMVKKAMASVPRYFHMGARHVDYDLALQKGSTYFTTDGCGVEAVDLVTGEHHASCKADVAMMARISDYLSSIGFCWTILSAQDYGNTSPLHELDASWNNTVKHVQSVTLMGETEARYAVEMGVVMAGSREELRRRPPFSAIICTIAPLAQDKRGIESALVLAEAGIPVGFLAMPTLGSTAPATQAGAIVVGDAEVISATVLLQLAYPGTPVFHSIMHAFSDPRSGNYVGYPTNNVCRYAGVEIAHHWGMPSMGGAYGTESKTPGTWQAAADVALDPFLVAMAGAEIVTGMGLNASYTVMYPEAIILDDELYHRARYAMMAMEVNPETLALDTIRAVGPHGHYLSQKHTRVHARTMMKFGVTHQVKPEGGYREPLEVAREKVAWILENHHPEPLESPVQKELTAILKSAEQKLG